ncbi:hypothetical protein J3D54_003883 [Pseudomonas sp. GGS8]|nr:hypothetical protein [Pseudomonas sp. GGS8]
MGDDLKPPDLALQYRADHYLSVLIVFVGRLYRNNQS